MLRKRAVSFPDQATRGSKRCISIEHILERGDPHQSYVTIRKHAHVKTIHTLFKIEDIDCFSLR